MFQQGDGRIETGLRTLDSLFRHGKVISQLPWMLSIDGLGSVCIDGNNPSLHRNAIAESSQSARCTHKSGSKKQEPSHNKQHRKQCDQHVPSDHHDSGEQAPHQEKNQPDQRCNIAGPLRPAFKSRRENPRRYGRLRTWIHARLKRHGTSATFALTAPFCVVPTAPSACNHDGLPLSEEPSTLKLHEEVRPPTLVRFRAGSSPPMTVSRRIYFFPTR